MNITELENKAREVCPKWLQDEVDEMLGNIKHERESDPDSWGDDWNFFEVLDFFEGMSEVPVTYPVRDNLKKEHYHIVLDNETVCREVPYEEFDYNIIQENINKFCVKKNFCMLRWTPSLFYALSFCTSCGKFNGVKIAIFFINFKCKIIIYIINFSSYTKLTFCFFFMN